MQGFKKVDPDQWEFANEGFLGGQKHLLKTIKRRRNVSQNNQQDGEGGGGSCVELGHYGLEGELEKLRRDRSVLMAEVMRLKQQQQNSRDCIVAMTERLQTTEKKQLQIMSFLAKAFNNPSFMQKFLQRTTERKALRRIESGRKRRLTASPSMESVILQNELAKIESELETMVSEEALVDESNGHIQDWEADAIPTNGTNLDSINETIWEELLSEDLIAGDKEEDVVVVGDQSEFDVPVEDLVGEPVDWGEDLDLVGEPVDWDEDLQDLVDQLGHLRSKP